MFSSMQYPHWMMIAGAVLVVLGFIGLAFRQNVNGETVDERTREVEPKGEGAMTEPKMGLAGLELKDAVRLRWTLHDIKSQRAEIVPISPADLKILIDTGLVEMRGSVPIVTPAGDAEIS